MAKREVPLPKTLTFYRCRACGALLFWPGGSLCTDGCQYDGEPVETRPTEAVSTVTYRLEGEGL